MPMIPQAQVPPQQQPNKSSKPSKPLKSKKRWVVVAIAAALAIALIVISNINKSTEQISQHESSTPSSSSLSVSSKTEEIPDPVIQTSPGAITELPKPKDKQFEQTEKAFIFNTDFVYPNSNDLADESTLSLGRALTYTPMKSCTYQCTSNKLAIAHPAGAYMLIKRMSYQNKVDYAATDQVITDKLSVADIKEVILSNVYLGSNKSGRIGKTEVTIDDTAYSMSLAYIFAGNELITVVTICKPDAEDFTDILYRNISIAGQPLTLA